MLRCSRGDFTPLSSLSLNLNLSSISKSCSYTTLFTTMDYDQLCRSKSIARGALLIAKGVFSCMHLYKSFLAHVFPIPKKGDKSDPSNYRPIAITSLISKTMETIVTKQLLAFLETNNLLSDHQYGFRQARSTGDLLAYAVHAWSSALESYGESRVISLDISKAFDRVWHKGLLAKLPMFGLHHTLITS